MAAAGTAVRALLLGPPRALRVLVPTPHAAYLADDDGAVVLALLDTDAVRVPLGVVLPGPVAVAGLRRDDVVVAGDGRVVVAGAAHPVVRWADTAVPRVRRAAVPGAHDLLDRLVARVGAGPGLTPETDDVLAGALAGLHAVGATDAVARSAAGVEAACPRTTAVSAALLRCAVAGHAVPQVQALVRALATGRAVRRRAALEALGRVGHTSGPALARGVRVVWARSRSTTGLEVA